MVSVSTGSFPIRSYVLTPLRKEQGKEEINVHCNSMSYLLSRNTKDRQSEKSLLICPLRWQLFVLVDTSHTTIYPAQHEQRNNDWQQCIQTSVEPRIHSLQHPLWEDPTNTRPSKRDTIRSGHEDWRLLPIMSVVSSGRFVIGTFSLSKGSLTANWPRIVIRAGYHRQWVDRRATENELVGRWASVRGLLWLLLRAKRKSTEYENTVVRNCYGFVTWFNEWLFGYSRHYSDLWAQLWRVGIFALTCWNGE